MGKHPQKYKPGKFSPGENSDAILLYRGIKAEMPPSTGGVLFVDDLIHDIFSKPNPGLMSPVTARYSPREAVIRYDKLKASEKRRELMDDHFAGERFYSVFVSATENEEEAAFFAASEEVQGRWGLIVRFRHAGPFVRYTPRFSVKKYEEILVVGGVEPESIEKVTLIGSGTNEPFTVHYIFRRMENGKIEKFRSPHPEKFHKLRNLRWSPETFFSEQA
ncbi:MAG: hypothetical protein ABIH66_07860 [bacterium]